MKFNLDKNSQKRLINLLETKDLNRFISDSISNYISEQKISKFQIEYLSSCSENEKKEYISNLLLDYLDVDLDDRQIQKLINRARLKDIKLLNPKNYSDNPYYKNIKTNKLSSFNFQLKLSSYSPYECFIYKDTYANDDDYYFEINNLAFFPYEYKFLELTEKNIPWMSITPNEINTMENAIQKSHDNVITFGLGLGYYLYMVSEKENVKSITVIEKDKNLIDIFSKHILNQFPNKDKIKIIEADCFSYLNNIENNINYNFAFVDTYHTGEDGLEFYIKFKKFEKKFNNIEFNYWIEDSIICYFRRIVLTFIEERFHNYDINYSIINNNIDNIIYQLNQLTLNLEFNSYQDIHDFISKDNLKLLASKINL